MFVNGVYASLGKLVIKANSFGEENATSALVNSV